MPGDSQNSTASRRSVLKRGSLGLAGLVGLGVGANPASAVILGPPSGGGGSADFWHDYRIFQDSLGDATERWADMPEYLTAAFASVSAEATPHGDHDYEATVSTIALRVLREGTFPPYDEINWDQEPIHSALSEFGVTVEPTGESYMSPPARRDFDMDGGGVGLGLSKFQDSVTENFDVDQDAAPEEAQEALSDDADGGLPLEEVSLLFGGGGFAAEVLTQYTWTGRILTGLSLVGGLISLGGPSEPPVVSHRQAEFLYQTPSGDALTDDKEQWVHHVTVSGIGVDGHELEVEPYIGGVESGNEWSFRETVDLAELV